MMKKMSILGLVISLLVIFSIGGLAQEIKEEEKENLPKAYLRTIPPEILRQYDPKILSNERPTLAVIKNEDIWDLRSKAKLEEDLVSFNKLDVDQLSPIQIKILQEWVKRGAKVYIKDEYLYESVVSNILPLFGVTVKDLGTIGSPVYFNKTHPVNRGVEGLPIGEEFKFLEAGPSGIAGSQFVVTNLPKERSVIVSLNEAQTKAFTGYFKYGEGTVYFNTLLLPWPGSDYNSDRFRLNLGQWLIGGQVPGLISEEEVLGFLTPSEEKLLEEEKLFPLEVSRGKTDMLNIEKEEDVIQIQQLENNPRMTDIVSIKCPRRDISQTNIDILKEWVKKGNVILLWSKPEYLADETIGFVGDDFGLRSKKSQTCYGKLVAVTQEHPLMRKVGKLLVFIPGIRVSEKVSNGYVYSDGFDYVLAKHEEEAIIVLKKMGGGWIIGLPWEVDKSSFDGERFWENLKESPPLIKSNFIFNDTTIKLYTGKIIEGMLYKLYNKHIAIYNFDLYLIIPWINIQSIKTTNLSMYQELLRVAPEKLQSSQGAISQRETEKTKNK